LSTDGDIHVKHSGIKQQGQNQIALYIKTKKLKVFLSGSE